MLAALLMATIGRANPPDLATLREEADKAWKQDVAAWANWSFHRLVERRGLDKKGTVDFRNDMEFQVTPRRGGFEEELLSLDGRKPSKRELSKHGKKARFSQHYLQAAEFNLRNPVGEDLALLPVIQSQNHVLVGEEVIDGIACLHTKFEARDSSTRGSLQERIAHAIRGNAWLSKDGYHVVAFEMETVRPLKKSGITLHSLRLRIEGQPVGEAWLPKLVAMESEVTFLGRRKHTRNAYRYTDFVFAPAESGGR